MQLFIVGDLSETNAGSCPGIWMLKCFMYGPYKYRETFKISHTHYGLMPLEKSSPYLIMSIICHYLSHDQVIILLLRINYLSKKISSWSLYDVLAKYACSKIWFGYIGLNTSHNPVHETLVIVNRFWFIASVRLWIALMNGMNRWINLVNQDWWNDLTLEGFLFDWRIHFICRQLLQCCVFWQHAMKALFGTRRGNLLYMNRCGCWSQEWH